jgi:hypothetical protein
VDQLGCGVAQLGCDVAQLVERWPAIIQISARYPGEVFPSERRGNEENGERPRRIKTNDCIVLYCDYECMY